MREILLNPDGFVIVRDPEDPAAAYVGKRDEFEADFGITLPEILEGMATAWSYRPDEKILVRYDKKGNAFPVEGEHHWDLAEAIYAAKPAGLDKQAQRHADARAALEAKIREAAEAQMQAARAAAAEANAVQKIKPVRL